MAPLLGEITTTGGWLEWGSKWKRFIIIINYKIKTKAFCTRNDCNINSSVAIVTSIIIYSEDQ